LPRSICALTQFTFLGVEPKIDETKHARFPPPWSAELQPNYYVVRNANGQQIAALFE
jgi:hypothetical protein